MSIDTNHLGLLCAEIDSAGSLKLAGDRVLFGAKRSSMAETEWLTRQKVAQSRQSIADVVHAHGGIICATEGDQVFCNLPNAEAALSAACEIQRRQGRGPAPSDADEVNPVTAPLGVRIAIHYATLTVDAGRILGAGRDTVQRLLERAEVDHVVTTTTLVDALHEKSAAKLDELGELAGEAGLAPLTIYRVDWAHDSQRPAPDPSQFDTHPEASDSPEQAPTDTPASPDPALAPPDPADPERWSPQGGPDPLDIDPTQTDVRLTLRFKGRKLVLSRAQPTLMLRAGKGRQEHAKIVLDGDEFVLENLNPRGTRMRGSDGRERLCTVTEPLTGIGAISLGDDFSAQAQVIHYSSME